MASCAANLCVVDLTGLVHPLLEIFLADLLLVERQVFSNVHSLVICNYWSNPNRLSDPVHRVIESMFLSDQLRRISLELYVSDLVRILNFASPRSRVENLSLRLIPAEQLSLRDCMLVASAISNLSFLESLNIPCSSFHRDTFERFGSLPSLQVLRLTLCTQEDLRWGRQVQLATDEGSIPGKSIAGFSHLHHLILDGLKLE